MHERYPGTGHSRGMKGVPRAPVIDDRDLIGPSQGPQSRHGRVSAPAGRSAEGTLTQTV